GEAADLRLAVAELERVVAVARLGALDLDDRVRTGLDDGDGDDGAVVLEELRHAELPSEETQVLVHRSSALDDPGPSYGLRWGRGTASRAPPGLTCRGRDVRRAAEPVEKRARRPAGERAGASIERRSRE